MAATLAELLPLLTREAYLAKLLAQLQGVGFTEHDPGNGVGSVTALALVTAEYDVVLDIVASGQLGTATFEYSTDGGVTFSAVQTIPSNGVFVTAVSGLTLVFANGPADVDTSFVLGDVYALGISPAQLPVTQWEPGGTALTILECLADALADLAQADAYVTAMGLVAYAKGAWLDLLATNVYQLTRYPGSQTLGQVVLTDGGAGPFTVSAGERIFQTAQGLQFVATSSGTLPLSGTLVVQVAAQAPGSSYNVGNNTITQQATPLAGVTVNNPPVGSTGTWISTAGSDTESDAALKLRCKNRWPASSGLPAPYYDNVAKATSPSVTRTAIGPDPVVPGQVDVYLANATGGVVGSVVTAVQAALNGIAPIGSSVLVASATPVVITVAGTVYIYANSFASAQTLALQQLVAYLEGVAIGGTVYLSQILGALAEVPGVRNVVLTSPVGDTALTAVQVATLTQTLVFVAV